MPVWFADWSLRSRSGQDTPSFEEWLWYQFSIGSLPKTVFSQNPDEDLDYYATSGLTWLGAMAYASNAVAAAEAAGGSAVASEFALWRSMLSIQTGARVVRIGTPMLAAPVVGLVAAESVVAATVSAASGGDPSPWWMPLPLYLSIFG